ncbi:MAG: polymorphic toxin-type HINT domain-containing protein [Arcicella sp.]|nr:polymorphic toxin-type HINT domain-containing protein [Arcicella sp.]
MKNFYFQLSLFLFCLLMGTSLGATNAIYSEEVKTPVKDKTKTENLVPKDKKEGRNRNDRPKKEDVPLNTVKLKKKNTVVALPTLSTPLKEEEERTLPVELPLLTNKNIQLLSTNLGIQKNLGPDPFAFTITTDKDSVGINEEFEVSIKVNWVDFGVNSNIRFLPEWYKYVLKVVMPKGFLQTGGDYTDYCTKPVDVQNPETIFTIKGKFEYQPAEAKFTVLRGFEGSNDLSGFVWKGEKGIDFIKNSWEQDQCTNGKNLRIASSSEYKFAKLFKYSCGDERYISGEIEYTGELSNTSNQIDITFHARGNCYGSTTPGTGSLPSPTTDPTVSIILDNNTQKKSFLLQFNKNVFIDADKVFNGLLPGANHLDIKSFFEDMVYCGIAGNGLPVTSSTAPVAHITGTLFPEISATGCPGTITWDDGTNNHQNPRSISADDTKTYKATCTYLGCTSGLSNGVKIARSSTPTDISIPANTYCGSSINLTVVGCDETNKSRWYTQTNGVYNTTYTDIDQTISSFSLPVSYNGNVKVYCLAGSTTSATFKEKLINATAIQTIPKPSITFSADPVDKDANVKITVSGCMDNTVPAWSTDNITFTTLPLGYTNTSFAASVTIYAQCQYSISVPGGVNICPSATVDKLLNVRQPPVDPCLTSPLTLSVVPTDATCGNYNGQIVATAGGSSQYQFKNGASGTYSTLSTTTINTFSNLAAGSYTIFVKDNQGCEKSETKSVGNANGPNEPTDVAGGNSRGAGTINLIATCASGTITWYDVAVGGDPIGTESPFPRYLVTEGDHYYYVACRNTAISCESGRIRATATILPVISDPCIGNPSSPSTTGDNREGAGAVTVRANCTTAGSTAKWYASNSSTEVLWSGSDYSTNISSTKTFFATCKNDDCESSRVPATATINAISNPCAGNAPPAPSPTSGSREGAGSVSIYASCGNNITLWYASASGGGILKTASSSQDDQFNTPNISATTVFYAACVNANGCQSGRVGVVATILPACSTKPIAPAVTSTSREASGSLNIYANCNVAGQQGWGNGYITTRLYDGSDRLIQTSTQDQFTVNVNTTTTFYAACYNSATNCESNRNPVVATVNPCSTPTPSTTNKANCGPGTFNIWANCNNTSLLGRWYSSALGGELLRENDHNNNGLTVTLSSSRLYYTSCYNPSNGCESQRVGVWAIIIPSSISTTSDVEVCEGNPINLQVTNTETFTFSGFAQPLSKATTYEWRGPNGYVSSDQNPTIPSAVLGNIGSYTSKVSHQYSHFLLNNGGPLCTATTVAEVMVYPNPAITPVIDFDPVTATVCQGKSVGLKVNNCGANDVLWYNSSTSSTALGNGIRFTVSVPMGDASATYYAACSSKPELGCNSIRKDKIITPIPAPAAPTNAKVNKPNTCIGSSVTLSASCPTGQTTIWYTGNANNDPSFTTLTFNLPAAGTYKYYAACKAGACETLPANRAEVSVTVNPYPTAPVSVTPSVSTICTGDAFNFAETCPTGQTLRWYSDMGGIITTIPGTYDYYLACQNNIAQCATKVEDRLKKTLVVNLATPVPVLRKQGDATEISSINLYTTQSVYLETKGCENCKVEWYEQVGSTFQLVAGENTSLLFVKKYQTGTYTYKAKYVNVTCSSNFSNVITITVNNCPDVAIKEVAPIYACGSGTTPLSISTTQIGDGINYEWFQETQDGNGYTSFTSTGVKEAIFYAQKGKYIVKSCLADNQTFGQSMPLEVQSFEVKAGVTSSNVTVETGTTLTLTGSDTSPITTGQTLSYLWTEPTVSSAVKTNTTLTIPNVTTANQEGKYTFTVSKRVGAKVCTNTATVDVKVNPTGCTIDFVAIPSFTCKKNIGEITVTTPVKTIGKTIYYRINGGDWQTENVFSDLAQGVYLVELKETAEGSTEYGDGGTTCYAISGAKTVNLDCSLLPQTECSALYTEESATIKEGESLKLSATGCPDNAKLIWAEIGTPNIYQNNELVSPTRNTTYEASCSGVSVISDILNNGLVDDIASPQQTFSCQSRMAVNVIASGCENFYAGDDVTIFKGESTILKAVNCSGTVRWTDSKGNLIGSLPNLSTPTVSPTITTTYSAFCYRGAGLQDCDRVVKVNVNANNCSAIKKFESDKKLVKTLDEKITFSYIFAPEYNFCTKIYRTQPAYQGGTYNEQYILANTIEEPNSFQISFNEIRKKVNVFHINETYRLMSQAELESLNTFFFDYNNPSWCTRQTKVKYLPYECSKFKTEPVHIITSGQQVVLSTTGCNNEITWKDITNNTVLPAGNPTVSPTVTTEYTATCHVGTGASEVCVVNKTFYVQCSSSELDATIANNANCNKILTITGCTGGTKKWMIPSVSTVMNSYTEGGTSIQYSQIKPADVFVFCIKSNPTQSCALKLPKPIQCNAECINLTDMYRSTFVPYTSDGKLWYGYFDNNQLFNVNVDKVKIYKGTNTSLSINVFGCKNSQINWIDLKTGNTIVSGFNYILSSEGLSFPPPYTLSPAVIPTETQDYKVECVFANGEKCSSNFTVEVKERCDDFKVTAPKNVINQGNSVTLTAEACPAANVLWNTGNPADDGKSTLTVSPSVATTYTVGCTWKDANGNNCANKTITIGVGVDCDLFKAKALTEAISVGGSATLKAEACIAPATLTWSTGETTNTITVSPIKNTTYTATCTLGAFSCDKNVLVKVNLEGNASDCAAFQLKSTPENVIQSGAITLETTGVADANTISWDNNLGIGSSKIVYPSDNTTYKATANLGIQGDYQRVCTRSLDVVVACNFTTTASPATLQAGVSATATLYAIGCSGKVSWYDGNNLLTGTNPVVQPTTTKTYDAVCDRGKSVCTSKVTVTVSANNCSSFAIQMQPTSTASSPAQVKFGEPVTLNYTNCTGNVTWSNGKTSDKDGKTLTVYPNESTNYTATCDATGCVAMAAVQVGKTTCDDFKVTGNTSIKVGDPANVVATGCTGTITWDWSPKTTETLPTNPTVTTTYIAICRNTGGSLCQKNLVVEVSSAACFGVFKATVDKPLVNKGENIILSTTGCTGTVTWSNGVASNTAFKPAETTEYTATCSNPICTSKIRSIVNPSLKIKTATKGNSVILTVIGCETGSLLWENDLGTASIITVSPKEQTTYTATCYYTDGTNEKVSTQVIPPCTDFNLDAPQKANKFDEISMSVSGCTNGVIKWTTDNNNSLRTTVGSYNSDRPQQTTTYTVLCEQTGCKSEKIVEISPIKLACPDLSITVKPEKINTACPGVNRNVSVSINGCVGGTTTWSKKIENNAYVPITPTNNQYNEQPSTTTTYRVECNYFGNLSSQEKTVTIYSSACGINSGGEQDPCKGLNASFSLNITGSSPNPTTAWVGQSINLIGSCGSGSVVIDDNFGNQYNNFAIIKLSYSGKYKFRLKCKFSNTFCNNVNIEREIEAKDYVCNNVVGEVCAMGSAATDPNKSLTAIGCPGDISWYDYLSRFIKNGDKIYMSEINKSSSPNVPFVKAKCNTSWGKTCDNHLTLNFNYTCTWTNSGRIAAPEAAPCADDSFSFRTMMKGYIQQFLTEFDKKNGNTPRTEAQGQRLANCIINQLKANTNFMKYQGTIFSPNVTALGSAFLSTGSTGFNNALATSFLDIQIKQSEYNADIQPTYEMFKKDVLACVFPNTTGPEELKIDNPYRCNVSTKSINFEGKTVFVGFDGNSIDITAQGKPVSFYGAEQVGHEGQIASFMLDGKFYRTFTDVNDNFVYYGYTNASPHGANKDLFYTSQIERYTVTGSTSVTPVLLKTNSFGNYIMVEGANSREVKNTAGQSVLSDCRFLKEDKCEFNSEIAKLIPDKYSQASKEKIFKMYNSVGTDSYGAPLSYWPPLSITFPWVSICKEGGYPTFSQFIQKRGVEINRIKAKTCNLWSQNELNIMLMEDLLDATPTCKAQLITKIASKTLGFGCDEQGGCEGVVLELLKSGKGTESALLAALKTETSIEAIEKGLDDANGEDNYTKAINILLDLSKVAFKNTYNQTTVKATFILGKGALGSYPNEFYNYAKLGDGFDLTGNTISVGKIDVFEPKVEIYSYMVDPSPEIRYASRYIKADEIGANQLPSINIIALDIYDPVAIPFTDNVSFLEDVGGANDIPTGTVPAFYIRYLKRKQQTELYEKRAINTAIVASYALGIGELATALRVGSTARTFFAVADIGSAIFTDVTSTQDFVDFLVENYNLGPTRDAEIAKAREIQTNCQRFGIIAQLGTAAGSLRETMKAQAANEALDAMDDYARATRPARNLANTEQARRTNVIVKGWIEKHLQKLGKRARILFMNNLSDIVARINRSTNITDFIAVVNATNNRIINISRRTGSIPIAQLEDNVLRLEKTTSPIPPIDLVDATGSSTALRLEEVAQVEIDGIRYTADDVELTKAGASAKCGANGIACFVAGTPVKVGNVSKPIESLELNDTVSAFDHTTSQNTLSRVTKLFKKEVKKLAKVVIGGAMIIATLEHPFFANGHYTPVKDLQKGDSVLTQSGKLAAVESVSFIDSTATVYNIEVAEQHNYFIGEAGLLVHNKCLITSLTEKLGTEWNKLQNTLITLNVPLDQRVALYKAIDALDANNAKAFTNTFAVDTKFAKGIIAEVILIDIWKINQSITSISILKSYRSIPNTIQTHLKVRVPNPQRRDIIGCHDATKWDNNTIVKKESLVANPTYTVPSGLPLNHASVPEVVIISDVAHPSISGVRVVTYRVPQLTGSNLTTGLLKGGDPFTKTIYNPTIWSDNALENACKEALKDAYSTGNLVTSGSSMKFNGLTNSGIAIEGYFDSTTKIVNTFYFK